MHMHFQATFLSGSAPQWMGTQAKKHPSTFAPVVADLGDREYQQKGPGAEPGQREQSELFFFLTYT